ncbi:uncharacterized protein LOC108022431 [Drosophila biarmipes]|uniref:uncharacterized protein LOC108022431 n=1 Tax=Drosophila biarmipes TaxID=125945 RepID=UPI0007E65507|nr:uncharacterized protein LOC108022431 [Drosophila biarmipes]
MEGPLSFLQFNPACLILIVSGFLLVEFLVNNWCAPQHNFEDPRCWCNINIIDKKCESETPLVRNSGLSHRAKLLASVKRRLDKQF